MNSHPPTASRRLRIASWGCTALAVVLGIAMTGSFLSGAKSFAFDPIGGSPPDIPSGTGATLLGMVLGVAWLPFALLAVGLNYRNLVAWAALILPVVVTCSGVLVFEGWGRQQPTMLTIGPVERAGTRPDDMHPMLRLATEKDTHRFNLDDGDQPFRGKLRTSSSRLVYQGHLDLSNDGKALSASLSLTSEKPFRLQFEGVQNVAVTSAGQGVAIQAELPPGQYDILFEADNPFANTKEAQ